MGRLRLRLKEKKSRRKKMNDETNMKKEIDIKVIPQI